MSKQIPISGILALAMHLLAPAAFSADSVKDLKCSLAEDLRPKYEEHLIDKHCAQLDSAACNLLLKKTYHHYKEIAFQVKGTCGALENMQGSLRKLSRKKIPMPWRRRF